MRRNAVVAFAAAGILTSALAALAQQAAPDPALALRAGKEAFEKSCKQCHGLDRPLSKVKTAAEWEGTVARMVKNGASVSGEQQGQIVAYLAAKSTFDTKCSACHGTDRPLGKNKSAADWQATVQRMAGKKPGHLADKEIADVAAYLSIERPVQ
jgi:mono/diheme cytochrome c family protein